MGNAFECDACGILQKGYKEESRLVTITIGDKEYAVKFEIEARKAKDRDWHAHYGIVVLCTNCMEKAIKQLNEDLQKEEKAK